MGSFIASLYMGLLILGFSIPSHAFKQSEMPDIHAWHLPTYTIDTTEFPMIPEEKEIQNFPGPIPEDEQDPATLAQYYEAVAKTYQRWANEQKDIVKAYTIKIQSQQEKLFINKVKSSRPFYFIKTDPFARAQMYSAYYYKKTYIPSNFNSQLAEKKAEFYQEIADMWKSFRDS
jgi:hypothetical protein